MLARILSVEQQKGIEGTGLLNGTLPITLTASGASVKNGTIEAQPPGGTIRYLATPKAGKLLAESDQGVKLVAQALNNFHYNVLRVGVQYREDGLLQLAARLEGRNPDMKKMPPIHFNVTDRSTSGRLDFEAQTPFAGVTIFGQHGPHHFVLLRRCMGRKRDDQCFARGFPLNS